MGTQRICPSCQKLLPESAPAGLCPACLMKAGFGTGVAPEAGQPSKTPAFIPPPVAELAKLFPQLEILGFLGRGGMGAVYKARQPVLDRLVALKILPQETAGDPGFSERFSREARALARLDHPNIVGVHDFGQSGGFHYFLMEFVDGANLRQIEQAGKLTPREALQIIPQICGALQFAHDEGIVHRDIKPENILVDKRGRVKIADFGIAKILGQRGDVRLTGARDVVGTPHYMAPEQVEKPQTVDHRADIYSLGVVFYEMLTGELPLGRFQSPSQKSPVDVRLDEVVLHALEKEPERRYQHASEVKTDVEKIVGTPQRAPATDEAASRPRPAPLPNRWEAALLGVGLTVYIALLMAIPTVSPPVRPVLTGLVLLGLMICFLILAGWWPVPSFLVPDSGFSRRNLPGRAGRKAPEPMERKPTPEAATPPGRTWSWLGFPFVEAHEVRPAILWLRVLVAWVVCFGVIGLVVPITWIVAGGNLSRSLSLPAALGLGWGLASVLVLLGVVSGLAKLQPVTADSGWVKVVRWTARVLGTTLLLFYGMFVLAEGLPPIATQPEGVQLNFAALGLMLAGFIVGWKREGTAAVLIASGWTLWHIVEGRMSWNFFQTPLPVAALYAFCWWATHRRGMSVVAWTTFVLAVTLGLGRWFLPTSVTVSGQVVDALNGQPVPNVELRLLPRPQRADNGDSPNAKSDQNGRYRLYVGWYAARKQLTIAAAGYSALTTNLGPRALGQRTVSRDFQLLPGKHEVATGAKGAAAVPPVVIATVPESGAAGVDPALTELRVTFSKPMQDGSWSWSVWGEENAPQTSDPLKFLAGQRTCLLPVRLQPGKVYALWLNSEKFKNFKDRDGRPALPYLLIFETRK